MGHTLGISQPAALAGPYVNLFFLQTKLRAVCQGNRKDLWKYLHVNKRVNYFKRRLRKKKINAWRFTWRSRCIKKLSIEKEARSPSQESKYWMSLLTWNCGEQKPIRSDRKQISCCLGMGERQQEDSPRDTKEPSENCVHSWLQQCVCAEVRPITHIKYVLLMIMPFTLQ